MEAQLVGAARAGLLVGHPVVPRERRRLDLDQGAGRPLGDLAEHRQHRLPPGADQLGGRHPLPRRGIAREEAVLRVEPDREVADPLLEHVLRPAAHQMHLGVGAGRQRAEQVQHVAVGPGELGGGRERDQGAVVVQEQQQGVGGGEPAGQRPPRRRTARGGPRAGARGRDLGELLEKGGDPAMHVEGLDPGTERGQACAALLARHRERAVVHLRRAVHVVRVHLQRLRQLPGGAGELAQDQHAVAVDPRGDELLGDQIHPVAQRGHQHHVGGAVERHQLGLGEAAEDVVHRHPAGGAERAVDPPDQPVDQRAEVLIGPHVGAGRHGHLDQAHLLPKLGVAVEHPLVGQEPAGDALGVVEPVHAHQDPHAAVAADRLGLAFDRGIGGHGGERLRVHAHREDAEPHLAAGELHPVDLDRDAEDVGERDGEMTQVRRGVEADEVGAEHALEHSVARGQGPEQLLGGERDVEEEPDARPRQPLAQEPGQEEELVVVDPDRVARPVVRRDHVGEGLVGLDVAVPVAHLQGDLVEQVVEQRPEHAVGEALVEPGDEVRRQGHPHQPHGGELAVEAGLLLGGEVAFGARPADPEPVGLLVGAHEPGGEPTGAPLDLHARVGDPNGDGKAVGDDHETGHSRKVTGGREGG